MSNPIQEVIDDIKKANKVHEEVVKNSEDVKSGKTTVEEEMKEPGNLLFNAITNVSMDILNSAPIQDGFNKIAEKLGSDETKILANITAVTLVQASFQSIVFYDELLKKEITAQFDNMVHFMNIMKADVEGHKGLIKIMKKQIGDLEEKIQIDNIRKQAGDDNVV